MNIEVGVQNMTLSWSPPYTIDGVPILQYTVYIISQSHNWALNTTETNINLRLERCCISTAYQISAWNEVGEGNTTTYGNIIVSSMVTITHGNKIESNFISNIMVTL